MLQQSISYTYKRYKTLYSDKISVLPILILMPHSACNCRCIMCDIWKGNKNLKQLELADIEKLVLSIRKLGTQQVVMSGGEALLNKNFFSLCKLLKAEGLYITLLSTGMTVEQHATDIVAWTDELITSIDGNEPIHDQIRNIPGAFNKLSGGIAAIKKLNKKHPVSGRTVIHRHNFRAWSDIIDAAHEIGLDSISFLPADISSQAFNREITWNIERQEEVRIDAADLPDLKAIIGKIIKKYSKDFETKFIAESPDKLMKIFQYYSAIYGLDDYPGKKCNAPWVSAVVEADGEVKPCFFHKSVGNIRKNSLHEILNGDSGIRFRKELDMDTNDTCRKCVCYLNLPPRMNPANQKR